MFTVYLNFLALVGYHVTGRLTPVSKFIPRNKKQTHGAQEMKYVHELVDFS